jgi:hypothetical protein
MENGKYSEASVAFPLEPSRRLAAFIVLAVALTAALAVALPLPRGVIAAAGSWCLVLCCHALACHLRHRSVSITGGTAIVVDGAAGTIVRGSFVAPWLTILHWRRTGSRLTRTVVILPDMIDAARFRELRVILRWAAPS